MLVVDSVEKSSGLLIGKKSRPSELTLFLRFWHYVIALWKCGLWEKFQKIRFGRDRWSVYAVPNRGWMLVVDSVGKIFRFVDRKKIQTIGTDLILKLLTLCDIALWKCGLWEKFHKIRFGRDRWCVWAVPIQGWMLVVDSVGKSSGLLIGKKSRPSELT